MIDEIKKHLMSEYPKEGCGIIYGDGETVYWAPIKNVATNLQEFILDKEEYLWYYTRYKILGIIHSHIDIPATPSDYDVANCNATGLPYYIFSIPSGEYEILEPKKELPPLLSRNYFRGLYDCFSLVKDYYSTLGIDTPCREIYWCTEKENFFTTEYLKDWGLSKTGKLEKNCFLTFSLGATPVPNHCGVYIGDNKFIHHAHNRLSCEESLEGIWRKYLSGVYKYEKSYS